MQHVKRKRNPPQRTAARSASEVSESPPSRDPDRSVDSFSSDFSGAFLLFCFGRLWPDCCLGGGSEVKVIWLFTFPVARTADLVVQDQEGALTYRGSAKRCWLFLLSFRLDALFRFFPSFKLLVCALSRAMGFDLLLMSFVGQRCRQPPDGLGVLQA